MSDDTVIWSAVGGADIYRGQALAATAGLHGQDEFLADFAKQVAILRFPVKYKFQGTNWDCGVTTSGGKICLLHNSESCVTYIYIGIGSGYIN